RGEGLQADAPCHEGYGFLMRMQLPAVDDVLLAVSHDPAPQVREGAGWPLLARPCKLHVRRARNRRLAREFVPFEPAVPARQLIAEVVCAPQYDVAEGKPWPWVKVLLVAHARREVAILADHRRPNALAAAV